jgi:hypothetical protein
MCIRNKQSLLSDITSFAEHGLVSPLAGEIWYASSILGALLLFGLAVSKNSNPITSTNVTSFIDILLYFWRSALLVQGAQVTK